MLVGLPVVLFASGSAGAADPPSATITPPTGLTSGQVVTVRGSGFPPSDGILIAECSGTLDAPPRDALSCDGTTTDSTATVGLDGTFVDAPGAANGSSGYLMRAASASDGNGVTCDAAHACVLYIGVQLSDFSRPHTFLAIGWAPGTSATASRSPAPAVRPPATNQSAAPAGGSTMTNPPAPNGSAGPAVAATAVTSEASLDPSPMESSVLAARLPSTGPPRYSLMLLGGSLLAMGAATVVRRLAMTGADGH